MNKETASREIESLDYYLQNHTNDYSEESHMAMMMAIKALEQQPCEDCISLNKLDDIITKAIDDSENQTECQTLRWVLDVMSELPSVTPQPKIGHWILCHPLQADDPGAYKCSVCGYGDWGLDPKIDKFCFNCGAKMEVEE